jgi:hypothetical protein
MNIMRLIISAFLLTALAAQAAPAPETDIIPESLEPWKAWALHGEEKRFCPCSYNDGEKYRCLWPAVLFLDVNSQGGRFSQQWLVFQKGWLPLPGRSKQWPQEVMLDGEITPVMSKKNGPHVYATPGEHVVEGVFKWHGLPDMIQVPDASGLIGLKINKKTVAFPLRDNNGRLWLKKQKQTDSQADTAETLVYRLLNDTIPMQVTTLLKINISGRAREITAKGVLLDGFIPLNITSRIPVRLDSDNKLHIQARPGRWKIKVQARSREPVKEITLATSPAEEEIWSFKAQNHLRMVQVGGAPSIDPSRTDIPNEWKSFPTFLIKPDDQMLFKKVRRGDPDPAPDKINLKRIWWLDFDGRGFTIKDRIHGTMSQQWRLAMNSPGLLGRVSVDGRDQLITSCGPDSKPGVELRKGDLNLVAESRLEEPGHNLPAVGWDHNFQSVSGTLNLPPGWRLLTAKGVDLIPGAWFARWTLLDLFLVLIISLSVFKLWDIKWGLLALIAAVLTYHEPGAPRIVWLHLLATTALLRKLPAGWLQRVVTIWWLTSFVGIVILSVPFMVNQVRWAVYPQLEPRMTNAWTSNTTSRGNTDQTSAAPLKTKIRPLSIIKEGKRVNKRQSYQESENIPDKGGDSRMLRQKKALITQDPEALIQTGPGLPNWKWRSYRMKWNGPVEKHQHVRLWMLSPGMNLALAFGRLFALAFLIFRMADFGRLKMPWGNFKFAAVLIFIALLPHIAQAKTSADGYPSKALLQELKDRLLEKPDCLPNCADCPQMELTVNQGNLHILLKIHAACETAVPLPGSLKLWTPSQALIDAKPAKGLTRDPDGSLWTVVSEGIHTVALLGKTPPGDSFQIRLPMKPQKVTFKTTGWDVTGISRDGQVTGGIKLTRRHKVDGKRTERLINALPPFLHVERILALGLNWQVWTTVRRVTPTGTPIVVSIPLIPGESVTTAGLETEKGKVLINMTSQSRVIQWNSTLKRDKEINIKAPVNVPWTETWTLDACPIWRCDFKGIPVIHHQSPSGRWRPQWKPWPGEGVTVTVSRPKPIPGQSVTIDHVKLRLVPGQRFENTDLSLKLRSSQGGRHQIKLPIGATLQQVMINGETQPITKKGEVVIIPLRPGSIDVDLKWRRNAIFSVFTKTPLVNIGAGAVNADIAFKMPDNRWILWLQGPLLGPAVLFWSYLFVIIIIAIALGRITWTPLKTRHWLLLGLGLTQIHPLAAIIIAGWLFALGMRAHETFPEKPFLFNAGQIIIVVWTITALIGLYAAIQQGLLGIPNMQVSGNGSSNSLLCWTQDRIGPLVPQPWVLSAPLFVFRFLMLIWALWLAYSLLNWLHWGWKCFSKGSLWKKMGPLKTRQPVDKSAPIAPPDKESA